MQSANSTPFSGLAQAALVVLFLVAAAGPVRGDLIQYLQKPEPAFRWQLNGKKAHPTGVVYELHLVSQVWQDIKWEHHLQVYQPKDVAPSATMLLWNTGGSPGLTDAALGMLLAKKVQAPCAFLYNIPNQPLLGGKKEDALIAETFVRFLETRDESWPLLFPMVKSMVKAMDVLQAFSRQEWQAPVEKFIVSGASKRGWTAWLTGASDPRVKAIAPMVIDTLNMPRQNEHQLEAYGEYSKEIADYTKRGLVPMPRTPEAKRLWSLVDPYWTLDSLNLYWDALKGEKWVLYVPNAGHNLEQVTEKGGKDITRALNGLAAFARHEITGKPLPRLQWNFENGDGVVRLKVDADPAPLVARLWVAEAPTQDFRKARWRDEAAAVDRGKVVCEVSPPTKGYRAFFAELDFAIDGLEYHLSTQVRVAGK